MALTHGGQNGCDLAMPCFPPSADAPAVSPSVEETECLPSHHSFLPARRMRTGLVKMIHDKGLVPFAARLPNGTGTAEPAITQLDEWLRSRPPFDVVRIESLPRGVMRMSF
jgi:hypothetical protein